MAARGRPCTSPRWAEAFVAGMVVLALTFGLLSHFGWSGRFAILGWTAAGLSLATQRPWRLARALRSRTVPAASVVGTLAITALIVRAVYYADRLVLTRAHPQAFAWIDTPLWLNVAYGLERSCPPAELLYSGQVLNYHFGAGLVVCAIRAMTGVSMQCAYFVAMCCCSAALVSLVVAHARLLLRFPRRAWLAPALVGVSLLEYFSKNFPSVVAFPVLLWLALELRRQRRWAQVPVVAAGAMFLMVTKEVEYVHLAILGGWIALLRLWRSTERRWHSAVTLAVALVATRPFYEGLIRIDQKAVLRPFGERLQLEWIMSELARQSPWLVVAAATLAVTRFLGRAGERSFQAVAGGTFAYVGGLLLSSFVEPHFVPPMDPHSLHWILRDMWQFEMHGRILLAIALVATALTMSLRYPVARRLRALTATVSVVALGFYATVNVWRCTPLSYLNPRPEERDDDRVAPLLAKVPVAATIVAAEHLNWNDENPHWAAFFGHQFLLLRRGRWVTAYKGFAERVDAQRLLFSTADPVVGRGLAAKHGVTHLIESRDKPVPWLSGATPLAENEVFRVFELGIR